MNTSCFGLKQLLPVLLWILAMRLPAANLLPIHGFHGPDYRVGLHTHQAYPADMAVALDLELAKWRNARAGWAESDLTRLINHANQFKAPLIAHGGISWSITEQRLKVTVLSQSPLQVRFDGAFPEPGEFLFADKTFFEVVALEKEGGTGTLRRLQGDLSLQSGHALTRYHAVLHSDAERSLRDLTCARLIIQLVLLPRSDDPLPAALFGADPERRSLAHPEPGQNKTTDFFNLGRFQAPLLADTQLGKGFDGRRRFVQSLYGQLVTQISAAARDAQGRSKIAYWLLGNEPDVLIPVAPDRYLEWLIAFDAILQTRQAPGDLLLANLSGLDPDFDPWLTQLEQAMTLALAEGRLDSARRPFQAAAITHYLSPKAFDIEHVTRMTKRFAQRIQALDALFDAPRPSRLVAKEIAFQGQSDRTKQLLAETETGELRADTKHMLRRYITALKQLGYDEVVWFNQMPTGFGHGKLIDDVRSVRETALGRYLRRLNQSYGDVAQAPVQVTLTQSDAGLYFGLAFQESFHAFEVLHYTLSLEDSSGQQLARRQGLLNRENPSVHGLWTDLDLGADYRVFLKYSAPNESGADFFHVLRGAHAAQSTASVLPDPRRRKNDPVAIPDPVFQQYLLEQYDLNQDGVLTRGEASRVSHAKWELPFVRDLTGLEAFINLYVLSIKVRPGQDGRMAVVKLPSLDELSLKSLRLDGFGLSEDWNAPPKLEGVTFFTEGNASRLDLTACANLNLVVIDDQLNTTPLPVFGKPTLTDLSLAGVVIDQPQYLESVHVDRSANFLRCTFPDDADLGLFSVVGRLVFQACAIGRLRGSFGDLNELRFARNSLSLDQLQWFLVENETANLSFLSVIDEPLGTWPQLHMVQGLTRLELIECRLESPMLYVDTPPLPPQLRSLSLARNQLTSLPLNLTPALTSLNLSGNQLRTVAGLRHYPQLEVLDVSDNPELDALPDLGFLSRLRFLNFRRCAFRAFPNIFLVPTLTTLYGHSNPFDDQCGQAAYYLFDSSRWYYSGLSPRVHNSTDLICDTPTGEPVPAFADQPLRSLAIRPHGNHLLLSWQGGARRNFQVERYQLETDAAWNPISGDPHQTQLALELVDEQGEFFLGSRTARNDESNEEDVVDQVALSLSKASGRWTYPLPHVPVDTGWLIDLDFTNQSSLPANIVVMAVSPPGTTSILSTLTLAGAGQQRHALDALLGSVPRGDVPWVLMVSDQPLTVGQTLSRAEAPHVESHRPLVPAYAREGFCYLPKSDYRFFRALVFTNTNLSQAAQIQVTRYDDANVQHETQTLNLAPGEKWVGLAADLVGVGPHESMLRWQSNVPVVDMVLYGRAAPFSVLTTDHQTNRAGSRGTLAPAAFDEDLTVINTVDFPVVVRFFHDDMPGRQQIIHLPPFGMRRIRREHLFIEAIDLPVYYEADGPVRISRLRYRRSYARELKPLRWLDLVP